MSLCGYSVYDSKKVNGQATIDQDIPCLMTHSDINWNGVSRRTFPQSSGADEEHII